MTVFTALRGLNQGHQIAAGWNQTAGLQNITSILGTDGVNFLPVKDRGFYSPGILRQLPTGGVFTVGLPTVKFISPWISDGQIERLKLTYNGNCTLKHHISESVGRNDVQTSNVIFNLDLNQLQPDNRLTNGYKGFIWNFVIVEVL